MRCQIVSGMLTLGQYPVDWLAVVMTILTSVDTISGEIIPGTIHAIQIKLIPRWQLLAGKWAGFAVMMAAFVAITFGGTIAAGYWIGKVVP